MRHPPCTNPGTLPGALPYGGAVRARDPRTALLLVLFAVAFGTNVPTPLLLLYRERLGLSATVLTAAFGVYAAGLLPALLWAGPASDRHGRRRVVVPFVWLSGAASLIFLAALHGPLWIFLGRLVQGAVSGVVFSVGSAWAAELIGDAGRAARRVAAVLSIGWAGGPLVAGFMAQLGPAPAVSPYLAHLGLMAVAVTALPGVPETHAGRVGGPLVDLGVPLGAGRPFALVVVPTALCVFTFASLSVTVLPLLLQPFMPGVELAVTGAVAGITMSTGAAAQPLARRLGFARAAPVGAAAGSAGLVLGLVGAGLGLWPVLLPAALLLGVGYGLGLASGLEATERLATPGARGALTATFYACAYLGFGVPVAVAATARSAGFTAPLAAVAVAAAVLAAAMATPAARRLLPAVTSASDAVVVASARTPRRGRG